MILLNRAPLIQIQDINTTGSVKMPHKFFICQYCHKQFYNSKTAYRNPKFCSKKCFHASYRVKRKCEYCNKEFETTVSTQKRFCSQTCANRYNQPKDPNKKQIFICQWCNKEFEAWVYRQPKFCSSQCRSEYGARQPKPNARNPQKYIILNCKTCGLPYKTTIYQVKYRGSNFCSRKCHSQAIAQRMKGNKNPNWAGGFNPNHYGPNWGSQSRKARKRDDYTCQICGYKSRIRNLDIHHIKPLIKFNGDYESANQINNLICLCRICHQQVECHKIPCPHPKEA